MAGINNDQTNKQNKTKPEKQLLHQWMSCCMLCYVSGTCVEKPVNYYIKKIQDLDNYIIQLYILKYVGSMK